VTVLVDGRPLAAYAGAYLARGRVFVPVSPVLTQLADRLWFDGDTLVVERDARRVRVRLNATDDLNAAFVPAAPVLRALGVGVTYDSASHRLTLSIPRGGTVASPTPFNSGIPSVAPSTVFTPVPPATPRPVWTGSPLPRRTALPVPPPRAFKRRG